MGGHNRRGRDGAAAPPTPEAIAQDACAQVDPDLGLGVCERYGARADRFLRAGLEAASFEPLSDGRRRA